MSEVERHAARPAPCRSKRGHQIDPLITRRMCWDLASCLLIWHQYVAGKRKPEQGCLSWLNARRHQKYKSEQSCGRGKSARRGKARKAAPAKRTVAKPKPKRAPVKKAARRMKQPVAPAVETVAVEVIEQPAPGVITVTEVEETPGSGLRRALKRTT